MTLAMFALTPDVPPRVQGCVTTFLALISVQFVAAAAVPKLAYSTRIDKFMLLSFFIIFCNMIVHSLCYMYRTKQERRTRHMRWRSEIDIEIIKRCNRHCATYDVDRCLTAVLIVCACAV